MVTFRALLLAALLVCLPALLGPALPARAQVLPGPSVGFPGWAELAHGTVTFSASGSMTWTVESGDFFNYIYSCSGGTCVISFIFNTTTTGGTPSNELRFSLPPGIVPVKVFNNLFRYGVGVTSEVGYVTVNPSWSYVRLLKLDGTSTWANNTNGVFVMGQITFAIQ